MTVGLALCSCQAASPRDMAIATAGEAYQRAFPQEIGIAKWEVMTEQADRRWRVMFATPMSDSDKSILGDIPRMGRMFIVSEDGRRVLDTLIAQ
jgi:hypothetical protein